MSYILLSISTHSPYSSYPRKTTPPPIPLHPPLQYNFNTSPPFSPLFTLSKCYKLLPPLFLPSTNLCSSHLFSLLFFPSFLPFPLLHSNSLCTPPMPRLNTSSFSPPPIHHMSTHSISPPCSLILSHSPLAQHV